MVSKSCVYPSLDELKLSFRVPLKLFALVKGAKQRLHISVALAAGRPTLLNFGFSEDGIREVHQFARVQISDDLTKDTFTPTFSMHDKSEFLSWVAEP